jgi:hypothetical protein
MRKLPAEQALQVKLVRIRPGHEFWKVMEKDIQKRSAKKDPNFKLAGFIKEYVMDYKGIKVYLVDGEWIRNNISVVFGHGGHGLVHEFIPLDECWIDYKHTYISNKERCSCRDRKTNDDIDEKYFNETMWHEVTELLEMKKGIPYWRAHITATRAEVGL